MATYVDDMLMQATVPNGEAATVSGKWSHLTADSEEELHAFAVGKLGMKRSWFQPAKIAPDNERNRAKGIVGKPLNRFHYDVAASKRALALKLGAVPLKLGSKEWYDVFTPDWRKEAREEKRAARKELSPRARQLIEDLTAFAREEPEMFQAMLAEAARRRVVAEPTPE